MLAGKEGRGAQKAMEILAAMGNAIGAGEIVKISYAHLMPLDLMFFPYGKQGEWAHDMIQDLKGFKERRLSQMTSLHSGAGLTGRPVKLLKLDMRRAEKSLRVKSWFSPSVRGAGAKPSGITTLVAAEKHRWRSFATVRWGRPSQAPFS
jgi:predicted aconitase